MVTREASAQRVVDGLVQGNRDPLQPEVEAIGHLRAYSNYLTPKLGLLSLDTWTLIATYLRNLVLIWLVIVPALACVLLVPRLWVAVLIGDVAPGQMLFNALIVGGSVAILSLAFLRPVAGVIDDPASMRPSPISAAGARLVLLLAIFQAFALSFLHARHGDHVPSLQKLVLVGSAAFLLSSTVYFCRLFVIRKRSSAPSVGLRAATAWRRCVFEGVAALATGIVTGLAVWGLARAFQGATANAASTPAKYGDLNVEFYAAFAPGIYLLLFFLQTTIFVGVAGKWNDDEDREWWARWAAWILTIAVAITSINTVVLLGPILLSEWPRALTAIGSVSGLLTLLIGKSGSSPATQAQQVVANTRVKATNYILAVAAPVFSVVLLILLALLTSPLIVATSSFLTRQGVYLPTSPPHTQAAWEILRDNEPGERFLAIPEPRSVRQRALHSMGQTHATLLRHTTPIAGLWLLVLLLAATVLASWAVHINRFSMHALYRNRLVRAYLGATNRDRRPNKFTGFDERDNLALEQLKKRPLHIVNMALNLVRGENLAWQQRKAESYTASPLHAGAARLGFRAVEEYAGGLTLGTSVAISGAAVSPNMGYHTSPAIAFLLTLFNIRLGWWLPNPGFPGQRDYWKHSPRFALEPILMEAFGLTDSRKPWVYLSDGGHFENLGLYEMVRRRCRTILVSDAGRDPDVAFEDLGNAIRKIRIDLGIPITIADLTSCSRDGAAAGRYHAIGIIHYDAVDDDVAGEKPKGTLIYVKPAVYGREPADVYNYARGNKDFPHEATSDQWFTESQFESYRALGLHVIEEICGRNQPATGSLEEFVERVTRHAHDAAALSRDSEP